MNKKTIKKIVLGISVVLILGASYAASQYFMPHRDIQSVNPFVEINAPQLVDEYLADMNAANTKYLDAEGESKVIVVVGTIKNITTDQKNQQVIILNSNNENLGVSCTFTNETNKHTLALKIGDNVKIKGVVRSGAEYDEDLDLYEDAILEKCDLIK